MKGFGLAFSGGGLLMVIPAVIIFVYHLQFMSVAKRTTGKVTSIKTIKDDEGDSYIPVITFIADTTTITTSPNNPLSPSYRKDDFSVGQIVEIFYDPNNKQNIFLTSFFANWGLTTTLGGSGFLFLLMGAGALYTAIKRKRMVDWLKSRGDKVYATFDSVQLNHSTTRNGDQHPYIIFATWTDKMTGVKHEFRTKEEIWEDPTSKIPTDKRIPVLIDPRRPGKRYWIDSDLYKA
jgi:hypothetical protein